ncbi:MAG: hypothetical protein JWQ27_1116 [Ferruginibacter sp.]|nr:hypothetical protein [Ferruginibacter sp.]
MLKRLFSNFFTKKNNVNGSVGYYITAQLNDKVGPIDRSLTYEEPLDEFLKLKYYGVISGGGTGQEKTGEIAFCDLEIELHSKVLNEAMFTDIVQKLEKLQAPKGSKLIIESLDKEIPFGKKEGLGLYIPNSNFPQESFDGYDINFAYSEMLRLMNIKPNADRSWGGKEETALYFYGESFEAMNNAIAEFVKSYPLCKNARIVQIA